MVGTATSVTYYPLYLATEGVFLADTGVMAAHANSCMHASDTRKSWATAMVCSIHYTHYASGFDIR
jgi:hypothetical protein